MLRGTPHDGVVNVLDGDIVVSEFEFQSHYYVHFRTDARGKGINYLIYLIMGSIVPLLFFYKDSFDIK